MPEAPQGARSDPIPPLATSSAIGHGRRPRNGTRAHGDYLLVLSSTHTSCQRHRRARVAPDTASGDNIGPGLPVPGGCVRGGRQTESRPRDDPGVPRPRGMRARGAPGRTAPSPARGDHGQHSHPQRPALLPRRPRGTPWRTCRPHRPPSPPRTPHPVADVLTLELMTCLTRGRVGALRGRHTTTTY